ncbi:MAG: S-adenosylmethionine synthase [Betaproteobacteria bacterium RBG_16_64_18]|nr:MAG: S-adenosylmethionine synthase [Betaproteobacteria bacterium RBG_16_64_18]
MNVNVTALKGPSPASLPLEIVERKGLAHPDSLCDALAENLSVALSRYYIERFGIILHHNVDKALLCGGAARAAFGGGEVMEPIDIYLAGRATGEFKGVVIPVDEIAVEASRRWLKDHLRFLDPERHVRILPRIRPTSSDLASLFAQSHGAAAPPANDTSLGVGYAPLDALESTVLAVEQHLNSSEVKASHPAIGEDIKVMGARHGDAIRLTVACAIVDRHVSGLRGYAATKTAVAALALAQARKRTGAPVTVEVNTADGDTADSLYLTVTGTSAEAGDDGQVGRGNRVNGLITPYRPMSIEAAAGKNPVTHVGKLYNVLAQRIARSVASEIAGVEEAYCSLLSQIGRPINEPQLIDVRVSMDDPAVVDTLRPRIAELTRSHVERVGTLWREVMAGTVQLY